MICLDRRTADARTSLQGCRYLLSTSFRWVYHSLHFPCRPTTQSSKSSGAARPGWPEGSSSGSDGRIVCWQIEMSNVLASRSAQQQASWCIIGITWRRHISSCIKVVWWFWPFPASPRWWVCSFMTEHAKIYPISAAALWNKSYGFSFFTPTNSQYSNRRWQCFVRHRIFTWKSIDSGPIYSQLGVAFTIWSRRLKLWE